MTQRLLVSACLAVCLLLAPATLAGDGLPRDVELSQTPAPIDPPRISPGGDGRIRINGPVTITEPGSYVVTRNIGDATACPGGATAITINADNVRLDLNGFTLASGSYTVESNGDGVEIFGGNLIAGDEGVLTVRGDNFVVRDVSFSAHDDNLVYLLGHNGLFAGNVLSSVSSIGSAFEGITVSGNGITVRDNVVRDAGQGIGVYGQGNQILRNTITGCITGIFVRAKYNSIDGNVVTGNSSFGILVREDAEGNVYRGNMVRGNDGTDCTGTASGGDVCDMGTYNTSHGDNYMPGKM